MFMYRAIADSASLRISQGAVSPVSNAPAPLREETAAGNASDPDVLTYARRAARAQVVLAILAVLFTLYVGRSLLLPVTIAVVLALLFRPVVRRLERWRVPTFVAAGLVLLTAIGGVVVGGLTLVEPASQWLDRAPIGLRLKEVEDKLDPVRQSLAEFSAAAERLQDFASEREASGVVEQVEVRQPSITHTVVSTTGELMASAAICFVVLYFLLVLGDSLLNSVVQVMPRIRQKREAVALVRNVERGVSNYLLTVTAINVGLGVTVGLAMWALQLPNPGLWGAMACILNFVPYIGALTGTLIVFLVALFSFDSAAEAAVIPLAYFAITAIEGNFVTPSVLGSRMSLNPIVVFLSLAFWSWMWGVGGALLAVPLLAIFKTGCDQFESTRPLSVLVSR